MSHKNTIEQFYEADGVRNKELLNSLLATDFILEWNTSEGKKIYNKSEILLLADELMQSFHTSLHHIHQIVEEKNTVAVNYIQTVSTIENPKELFQIAHFMAFWEFQDDKISKLTQISNRL